jgi:hypothetical protein
MAKGKHDGRRGGRYTPPKRSVSPPGGAFVPRFVSTRPAAGADPFVAADRSLRERCEALIGEPISNSDWMDADLIGMDGLHASDEELRSYWAVYRKALELDPDLDESPELRFVMDALDDGDDPVEAYIKWWNDLQAEIATDDDDVWGEGVWRLVSSARFSRAARFAARVADACAVRKSCWSLGSGFGFRSLRRMRCMPIPRG